MKRLFVSVMVFVFAGGIVMAIEEPDYTVVKEYETFEVRDYAPYLVAEVTVNGDFSEVGNTAFRILFDFISGDNRTREKIKMTAPVNQEPVSEAGGKGETIEMTAPVVQTPAGSGADAGAYVVGFVMPAKYTLETVPQPTDSRITLRQVPARRVAVIRYSGRWTRERYQRHETKLLDAVSAHGYTLAGAPVFARYNSPFMPWFMRRNEIHVAIKNSRPVGQEF